MDKRYWSEMGTKGRQIGVMGLRWAAEENSRRPTPLRRGQKVEDPRVCRTWEEMNV
jgi:hypothetical protein